MKKSIIELDQALGLLSDMAAHDTNLTEEYRKAYLHVVDMVRDWCRRTLKGEDHQETPVTAADLEKIQDQLKALNRKTGGRPS